jgi:hypothetical protein
VIEQLKLMAFHNNLGTDDVFHWYSSSGWIMWNAQVAGLLLGTTIALYDGNPAWPDAGVLWRFVDQARVTMFGAGAAFFTNCMKAGVEPAEIADLSRLRGLGSTGSPLPEEAYDWIYGHVRADIWLAPMSGGTDFAGSFVAGCPLLPVYQGEMQCRCLGAKVEAFDDNGKPLIDEVGELVCTEPMPSMPLFLWGDADGKRYRDSYFDTYPNAWRHGDWIRITPRGGAIIYGRSDATINRYGIRMGTSELYRVVESCPKCSTAWWSISNTWAANRICRCSWCCERAWRWTMPCATPCARAFALRCRRGTCRTRSCRCPACRARSRAKDGSADQEAAARSCTREDRQPRCHGESRVPDVVLRVCRGLPDAPRNRRKARRQNSTSSSLISSGSSRAA